MTTPLLVGTSSVRNNRQPHSPSPSYKDVKRQSRKRAAFWTSVPCEGPPFGADTRKDDCLTRVWTTTAVSTPYSPTYGLKAYTTVQHNTRHDSVGSSIPIKTPQPYVNIDYHDHGFFIDMPWSLWKAGHSPGQPAPRGLAWVGPGDLLRSLHTSTILWSPFPLLFIYLQKTQMPAVAC